MKYIKTYEYLSEFLNAESAQTDYVFSIYPGVACIRKIDFPEEVIRAVRYNPPHFVWEVETSGYTYDFGSGPVDFTTLRDLVTSGATAPYFLITSQNSEIVCYDNYDYLPHVIIDSSWNCEIEDQSDPGNYIRIIRHYTNPRYNIKLDITYLSESGQEFVEAYVILLSNEGEA